MHYVEESFLYFLVFYKFTLEIKFTFAEIHIESVLSLKCSSGSTRLNNAFQVRYMSDRSCMDIKRNEPGAETGTYPLEVSNTFRVVMCDMSTDGGGWTVGAL